MLSRIILAELKEYVEKHLDSLYCCRSYAAEPHANFMVGESMPGDLADYVEKHRKPDFRQVLFHYIDKKGLSDSELYTKAGIDRRHFSKIRSNSGYKIGRNSAIALALALELGRRDTDKLLSAAGYSLSDNNTFDLVILYCLEKGFYNLSDVNEALDYFSLKPLSGAAE